MRMRTSIPRPRSLIRLMLCLCSFAQPACHSWKMEPASPSTVVDSLHPTRLRVTTRAHKRVELWRPRIRMDTIVGYRHSGTVDTTRSTSLPGHRPNPAAVDSTRSTFLQIPIAEITRVETRHGNVLKTVGLVYLIVAAITIPTAAAIGSTF